MSADDPFDLPSGYGGVSRTPPQSPPTPDGGETASVWGADARSASRSPWGGGASNSSSEGEPRSRFTDRIDAISRRLDDEAAPPGERRRWRWGRGRRGDADPGSAHEPFAQPPSDKDLPPAADLPGETAPAVSPWRRRWPWIRRGLWAALALVMLAIGWLAFTAPLSKSLEPIAPPRMVLLSREGRPIARTGAEVAAPVDATKLPRHVREAFLAIEDRRFYSHWGVDPRGIARAAWSNITNGTNHGGSTITQQLAKITFLNADQTIGRKARELLIAWWMEAWLTKDQILSRYLSNAYFGDNVYGLRAASLHYFYRQPERLTLSQATMLAGLVKAPSRLAPTRNLARAQARQRLVIGAMADAGFLTPAEARRVPLASLDVRARTSLPTGTYFADWAQREARASVDPSYREVRVTTTLDARLQDIARRVTAQAPAGTQVALVAMRPNGEVVAMIGGRDYARSSFNRATQARRQPGSVFKLAVYYAALKSGMRPDDMVDDRPIREGDYRPANYGDRYGGRISLREAFARSSNVVAVRLYQQLGHDAVEGAARELGIDGAIPRNASAALGSGSTTLIDLTSAFAGVAGNYAPVEAHALRRPETNFVGRLFDGQSPLAGQARRDLVELLLAAITDGTGRAARLAIPAYGKTGTTQNGRDALFVGWVENLVVGVWVGRDDNQPVRGLTGGGVPARIWRDFMVAAVPGAAPRRPAPPPEPETIRLPEIFDDVRIPDVPMPDIDVGPGGVGIDTEIGGVGVRVDGDGVRINGDDAARRAEEQARAVQRKIEDELRRAQAREAERQR